MKHPLLAITSALLFAASSQAGEILDKTPEPVAPATNDNPLSFFDNRLVIDFQERLRYEYLNNDYDFNAKVKSLNDTSLFQNRARLGVTFAPEDWLTFYVQGESSYEFGDARPKIPGQSGAEGNDQIDLFQAYVKLGDKNLNVTVGRQTLSYGDERLVGAFDWNNIGRTFDAVKFHYSQDTWSIEAFASSVVTPESERFDESVLFNGNATTGRNQIFSGLYFSSTGLLPVQTTDLYAFEMHEEYSAGNTDFVTLGTRMKGDPKKLGGFDYETEMAAQTGNLKGKDLEAFAGHWGVGYNWLDTAWKPRIGVEYNYATGDDNPKDGTVNTFQNLFPTNHPFYGTMDLFSWQNISNPAISFSMQPLEDVKVKLDYNLFWLANTSDGWYRANGTTLVRPITPGADPYVGSEVDLTVSWKLGKHVTLSGGYDHFFDGKYAKASGADSDADFAYAMITITF